MWYVSSLIHGLNFKTPKFPQHVRIHRFLMTSRIKWNHKKGHACDMHHAKFFGAVSRLQITYTIESSCFLMEIIISMKKTLGFLLFQFFGINIKGLVIFFYHTKTLNLHKPQFLPSK